MPVYFDGRKLDDPVLGTIRALQANFRHFHTGPDEGAFVQDALAAQGIRPSEVKVMVSMNPVHCRGVQSRVEAMAIASLQQLGAVQASGLLVPCLHAWDAIADVKVPLKGLVGQFDVAQVRRLDPSPDVWFIPRPDQKAVDFCWRNHVNVHAACDQMDAALAAKFKQVNVVPVISTATPNWARLYHVYHLATPIMSKRFLS